MLQPSIPTIDGQSNNPVLIAGAGPTGMMAALELARMGIPVRLIDRLEEPLTTSRAVGVQARTLELFEQRGFAHKLVARGNECTAVSAYGAGKRVFRLDLGGIDSRYPFMLMVSQAETESVLRDALAEIGVRAERSVSLLAIGRSEGGAGMTTMLARADGSIERFDCSYLIDAEGAHSVARSTLGLQFHGKALKEQYALGDIHIDGHLTESELHIFSSEFGFMGLFPLGKRHFRLIASNPAGTPSKDTAPTLEQIQHMYDQRSHIPARFRDMSWSSWFRINSRMLHELRLGEVFFGGDSAHIHSPAGAQGMNTGIQDMANLGWKLAMVLNGNAKPDLLETYSGERVAVIQSVLTQTENLTHAIGEENAIFRSLFNVIAPCAVGTEVIEHTAAERLSQLSLNYRRGPLGVQERHDGELHAGDRLPNVAVTVLNQEHSAEFEPRASTMFELANSQTFTLFFTNIANPSAMHDAVRSQLAPYHRVIGAAHVIGPVDGGADDFAKLFGRAGGIYLVRPDGYLALCGLERELSRVRDFCERWLLPHASESPDAARTLQAMGMK